MARIAVISDIHGNIVAFDRVIADMRRRGIDMVVCLGDIVGYGDIEVTVVAPVDLSLTAPTPRVTGGSYEADFVVTNVGSGGADLPDPALPTTSAVRSMAEAVRPDHARTATPSAPRSSSSRSMSGIDSAPRS